MAGGWTNDDAVNDQIAASVADAVARARASLSQGESRTECELCGEVIPLPRQKALPGVRLCLACQEEEDKTQTAFSGYNRKGSKDSQLR